MTEPLTKDELSPCNHNTHNAIPVAWVCKWSGTTYGALAEERNQLMDQRDDLLEQNAALVAALEGIIVVLNGPSLGQGPAALYNNSLAAELVRATLALAKAPGGDA